MKRLLLACALGMAPLMFVPGCSTLEGVLGASERPSVSVKSARVSGLMMDGAGLEFDVSVRNPYAVPLPLTAIRYELASGGAAFASGESLPSSGWLDTIPAGESRVVTLPVGVRFAELMGALSGVRPGQLVPYDAALTLVADAPGVGPLELPLRRRGELPVPAAPEVSMARLTFDELSINRAAATAVFDVKNTNQFALNLAQLNTDVSLGGRRVAGAEVAEALRLGAGRSGRLSVPLSFSPMDFGVGMLNMLRGSESDYSVRGGVRAETPFGPLELPFEGAGSVPLGGG